MECFVQIGVEGDSLRLLEFATDEWAWLRILELRQHACPSRFRFFVRSPEFELSLISPIKGWSQGVLGVRDPFAQPFVGLWCQMGMDDAEYTPGAAISFLRRVRFLMQTHCLQASTLRVVSA